MRARPETARAVTTTGSGSCSAEVAEAFHPGRAPPRFAIRERSYTRSRGSKAKSSLLTPSVYRLRSCRYVLNVVLSARALTCLGVAALAAFVAACANSDSVPAGYHDAGNGAGEDSPSSGYDAGPLDVAQPEAYSGPMSAFAGTWTPVSAAGGTTCSDGSSSSFTVDPTARFIFVQTSANTISLTAADGCVSTFRVNGLTATMDPPSQSCTQLVGSYDITATWSTSTFTITTAGDAGPAADATDDGAVEEAGATEGGSGETMTWDDVATSVVDPVGGGTQVATCNSNGTFTFTRD